MGILRTLKPGCVAAVAAAISMSGAFADDASSERKCFVSDAKTFEAWAGGAQDGDYRRAPQATSRKATRVRFPQRRGMNPEAYPAACLIVSYMIGADGAPMRASVVAKEPFAAGAAYDAAALRIVGRREFLPATENGVTVESGPLRSAGRLFRRKVTALFID